MPDELKQRLVMSSQEVTSELEGERIREEKQQSSVTENEEQFKGPRFYPPVYRRRYAAVCELVKKRQAKRVQYLLCFDRASLYAPINVKPEGGGLGQPTGI